MRAFHWLKLEHDYTTTGDMKVIRSEENGAEYALVWLDLLGLAIMQDEPGCLRFKEEIPFNDKLLSTVLNADIDVVRSAMKMFKMLGMLSIGEDGTIYIESIHRMIGSESSSTERVRRFRERQKALLLPEKVDETETLHETLHVTQSRVEESREDKDTRPSASDTAQKSSAQEYSAAFESFWQLYPRKKGKITAFDAWKARVKRGAKEEDLIAAARSYAAEMKRDNVEDKYIKHPSTFLGPKGYWRDYLGENIEPVRTREEAARALFGR